MGVKNLRRIRGAERGWGRGGRGRGCDYLLLAGDTHELGSSYFPTDLRELDHRHPHRRRRVLYAWSLLSRKDWQWW